MRLVRLLNQLTAGVYQHRSTMQLTTRWSCRGSYTATAATTLQTGDAVRLIGTIDMTAADYANIDADNFAAFV